MVSRQVTPVRSSLPRAALVEGAYLLGLLLAPSTAHASLLSPEMEDKLATVLALFVIFVVPVVLIVLFWIVHILPEKIAHKRHHPQFEAIRTLCLLSLVFGGLLWPLAWLWAYSKPVMYKLAYGSDTIRDPAGDARPSSDRTPSQAESHEPVPAGELMALRAKLEALEARLIHDEIR
jgi:hypothetical protein